MKTNGIELYFERTGEGEPIVFSGAWLDDLFIWKAQVKHFSKRYSVITYDQRGHGKSDKARTGQGNYSVQALAEDLNALIQKLNLDKPMVVGFSMGGMVALRFAIEHPDEISKLVLVGTCAKMAPPTAAKFLKVIGRLLPTRTFYRMLGRYRFYKPSEQVANAWLERALKVDKAVAFESWSEWAENFDLTDQVSKIRVPTLIIVGEKDDLFLETCRYLNENIKGSQLRVVTGSGHTVSIEKPEEFNQILEEFIARPVPRDS
jgi:pimeloyl-ACP methyl ester carboxylesterase